MSKKTKILSSIGWTSLQSIVSQIILLSRTFILVKILTPDDFGIVALSLLFISTLRQFTQTGLEQALIEKKSYDSSTIDTIWTVSIARGIVFSLLIYSLAPFYSKFFEEPNIIEALNLLSLSVLILGFKNSYLSLYQKRLHFKKIFLVNVIATVIEFIVTISFAYFTRDLISLIYGHLTASVVSMLLSFLLIKEKPHFRINIIEAKKLFSFGKWVFSGAILIYCIVNIDVFIIGKILGVASLGAYKIAYRFANLPATDLILSLSKSLYPAYTSLTSNKDKLKEFYLHVVQITGCIVFPFSLILMLTASEFVQFVLGPKWILVVQPITVLSLFGLFRSFASNCGYMMWAIGKPNYQTKISLFQLFIIIITIKPGLDYFEIVGVAYSVTFALALSSIFSFKIINKYLKIKINAYKKVLIAPFLASVVLSILLILSKPFITSIFSYIVTLILSATFYIAFCVIIDFLLYKNLSKIYFMLFRKKFSINS